MPPPTASSRAANFEVDADGLVTTYVTVPPDGGWGWVVLVTAFYVQMLFGATIFAVSSLVEAVAADFHSTMGHASVYSALFGGCSLCVGPLVSVMAHKYGFRTVTSIGTVVGTFGFVGAFYADSLPVLIFSFGFLGGVGFGMLFVPSILVAALYFERWRALVQGITVCGSSVGGAIAPPLVTLAVDRLGWRYTILIEAGMLLSCGLASLLYLPLTPVMKRVTPAELTDAMQARASRTHLARLRCDCSLCKSPSYLLFGVCCMLCMAATLVPFVYLPDRSHSLGVEASTVELLIPVSNIVSTLGRLVCGVLASSPRPVAMPIFGATIFAAGAALCFSGLSADSTFQITCVVLFGLFMASFNALRVVILVELVGLERLTTAFGYLLFTQGLSVMAGPPLAGQLKEATGNYDSVFWFAGSLLLVASMVVVPLPSISHWEKKRDKRRSAARESPQVRPIQ